MSECAQPLCVQRAATLDRLLASVDTFALAASQARVRELEEIVDRQNRNRPHAVAVEVCAELAATDPRDHETLRCLWCGEMNKHSENDQHRTTCAWRRAGAVAERQAKDETKAVVNRWTA